MNHHCKNWTRLGLSCPGVMKSLVRMAQSSTRDFDHDKEDFHMSPRWQESLSPVGLEIATQTMTAMSRKWGATRPIGEALKDYGPGLIEALAQGRGLEYAAAAAGAGLLTYGVQKWGGGRAERAVTNQISRGFSGRTGGGMGLFFNSAAWLERGLTGGWGSRSVSPATGSDRGL